MRRLAFLFLVPMLLAALAAPLGAQEKDELCNDIQRRPMRVGQWASYAWTGGGPADGTTMRFAVVGTEPVEGTNHYWFEMLTNDPKKGPKGQTIMQMLVPELGFQSGGVRGIIMKSGEDQAMRMPDQMVQMMGSRMGQQNLAAEIARGCRDMELVGWEQVTVPAGTFRALHVKNAREQVEAWILPDLYFGLLRATMKDGSAMALTGRGSDAKSSIPNRPAAAH